MKTSIDIIRHLTDVSPDISEIELAVFSPPKSLQERIEVGNDLQRVVDSAFFIRENYKLPFWDSFNLSLFNKELDDMSFMRGLLFHNKREETFLVPSSAFDEIRSSIEESRYLTFCSRVKLRDGSIKHFLLLDFHIPNANANDRICLAVLKALGLSGFLLDSGKSYHFYGTSLFSEEEIRVILTNALLFAPIIDRAWIAHQLLERCCCLRISRKYSRLPFLVQTMQ